MFKQNIYARVTMLVAYKVITYKYTLSLGFWKYINNSNNKNRR